MSNGNSNSSDDDLTASSRDGEDAKMDDLLKAWDEHDDVYVDSDSEAADDDHDTALKMARLKANNNCSNNNNTTTTTKPAEEAEWEESEEKEMDEESEESEFEEIEVSASEESDEAQASADEEEEEEEESEEESEEEEEVEQDMEDVQPVPVPESVASIKDDDEGSVVDDGVIEDTLKKKPKRKKEKVKVAPLTAPSKGDTEEDAAMKALLGQWSGDDDEELDDGSDEDDEESEASEREIGELEDNVIDHIVLAAPDLDEAIVDFEKMTGIAAQIFGSINGLGIRCARISFTDSTYLEIIAPDPKSPGPIGNLLRTRGIKELTPFHFAIRSSKAEELKTEVKKFGYVPDHITMFGGQKDGVSRKWEMLFLYGHRMGGICPFFIHWANSDHPCAKLPVCGKLKKFSIRAPQGDPVHALIGHIGVRGLVVEVGTPKLSFQFSSPEGTVKFATNKPVGFKFPGFDDENDDLELESMSDEDEVVFALPAAPELVDVGGGDYEDLPPPTY